MRAAAAARAPSLGQLRQELIAPAGRPFSQPAWLAAAYEDPDGFWRKVAPALLAAGAGSARSSLFERYVLFHELGARQVERGRLAWAALDDAGGVTERSYASVVDDASRLARAWRARGLAPGDRVVVLAPISSELVVALLAAWRCGAVAVPLPPLGPSHVRHRLAAAAAPFVATTDGRGVWLRLPEEQVLPLAAEDGLPDRDPPHAYGPDDPAAAFFSPLGRDPLALPELTAERLLLGALRDGVLLLGLDPGDALTAPGFCDVQHKPPLLLATLAAGGCFLEVGLETAARHLDRLLARRPQVVGVHQDLRDAALAAGRRGLTPLRRWFRNPADAPDREAWTRFAALPIAEAALGGCYFGNGAAGGAIVASAWRRDPGGNLVLPAPGRRWQLAAANLGGVEGLSGSGVLASPDEPASAALFGRPVLARHGDECLWVAALGAHRSGQTLPGPELTTVARRAHPELQAGCVIDVPVYDGGLTTGAAFVGFLRPDVTPACRDALRAELDGTFRAELGEAFAPDRIELYTIAPRLGEDGALDEEWCRAQQIGGLLALKQKEPLFTTLAIARQRAHEETPAAPG